MSSKIMYSYRAFDLIILSEMPFRELLPASQMGADDNQIMIGFNSVSPYGLNRPLWKLSDACEIRHQAGAENQSVHLVHEDSSTALIPNFAESVELPKRSVGELSLNTPYYQATENELWLHIPDVARFLIKNGNKIYIDPMPNADEDSIRLFVLGSCMGALLMQRQLLLLHGNAIKIGTQCISFIGNSGSGKSSLSAAFFNRGYSILADDICAINNQGAVLPSFPQIKLWADVAKTLMFNTQTLKKIRPNIDKFAIPLKQQFYSKATQLKIVYLLETDHQKEISITPIQGIEKLHSLQHHVYRKMYLSNQARKHLCFKQCMQLASIIEFVRIRRPIDRFTLDEIINKIKLDLLKRGFTENDLTK